MLLDMKSLTQSPRPSSRQYDSFIKYIQHGPPIHLTQEEVTDPRWPEYEKAVQKILDDPATAPWLDGPLDPGWTEAPDQRLNLSGRADGDRIPWGERMKSILSIGAILFWISHVTTALAFFLIAITVSEANRRPTVRWYAPIRKVG